MYINIPYGNRTRVSALKKRCPRPLDERDSFLFYFFVPSEGSTLPCEAPPSEGGAYFLPCKAGKRSTSLRRHEESSPLNFPSYGESRSCFGRFLLRREVLPTYRPPLEGAAQVLRTEVSIIDAKHFLETSPLRVKFSSSIKEFYINLIYHWRAFYVK